MTELVQVALAEDITEAEELQEILRLAGIDSHVETAVEHHPTSIVSKSFGTTVAGTTVRASRAASRPR